MAPSSTLPRGGWCEAMCLAAVLALAGYFVHDALRSRAADEALLGRLQGLEARRARLEGEIRRCTAERRALEQDPFAVERRLREKMGRSQPGEILLQK